MDLPEYQLKTVALQRRLGEFLLNQDLLTPDQLEEAIEYQCIYGGRLGTSLIELGYLSEEELAQVLSQQLKLHYIKPDLLMNVPDSILNLVPEKIALKYKVVPYHKEKKRLFLAMNDATNLADIDDLSFQLDHIIVPLAIPEIRLMMALKQHYGLDLTPRFETLAAQLLKRAQAQQQQPPKEEQQQPAETSREESWPLLGDMEFEEEADKDDAYFNFTTPPAEISYTSLCQQLASANDRNDIARSLMNYLGQEFSASGIFVVRSNSVSGWMASHNGNEPDGFDQYSIALSGDSVIKLAIDNQSHYLGPMPDSQINRKLQCLFTAAPPSAMVVPLMVRDRLVCILYVQDHLEILEKRFADVKKLAKKAELAFMMLIMKNKVLTT